ncbi:cytochrome P450 2D14-like [Gopherus flavomarginatus]|uniref:cytochrome P450 2D14-like n=1 Tax=Gopherus flavomarginatus TaxID=286002 RepID=UPI0021CBC3C1|nr:cytochrome P450 2D14-like [Gopherus flavomarginatus]
MELLSWLGSQLLFFWNSFTTFGLSFAVFILVFDHMKRRKRWKNYPPGPVSFPFVGNLLQVNFQCPRLALTELSEKFGKIFSFQVGWKNVVVLNGLEAVKAALVQRSEDFADRPSFSLFDHMGYRKNCEGIMMAKYGHGWKKLRRFALSTLRNFGLGKKSLDQSVTEEAGCLCSAFSSKDGRPFKPRFLINSAVGNVMCSITFGERFEYNNEKFQRMLHLIEEAFNIGAGILSQILDLMPWLLYIPGPHHNILQPYIDAFDILREIVKKHKETRDPGFTRDFIDAFLEEIEKAKMDPESTFNEDNLIFTVFDLFGAATETTTVTLCWALLYMLRYPDVQRRVHEEIDKVIGRDRSPKIEDQVNLPYTNAVIYETQRYCDVVFAGVPHTTYRDTQVQDFFIPKGTIIIAVLSSVLKDETVWEKPHEFYPEHFLDADEQFVKREAFLPFSAGRRMCLGEQLARKELFLFFTTLLQHFTFHIPENQPRPQEDGHYVLIHSPDSYELCAIPR